MCSFRKNQNLTHLQGEAEVNFTLPLSHFRWKSATAVSSENTMLKIAIPTFLLHRRKCVQISNSHIESRAEHLLNCISIIVFFGGGGWLGDSVCVVCAMSLLLTLIISNPKIHRNDVLPWTLSRWSSEHFAGLAHSQAPKRECFFLSAAINL